MEEKSSQIDFRTAVQDKILELQSSNLSSKGQVLTLLDFIQTLFGIDTLAAYANFGKQEINLLNSKSGLKQHALLGYMIENIAEQLTNKELGYFSNLIHISELNIKMTLPVKDDTYVYTFCSSQTKQIYGLVLLTSSLLVKSFEEKKVLLFALNYITKIIEESDLNFQTKEKDNKLKLLSTLYSSLRGVLKSERAIEIVLKEIYSFLKLENIYYVKFSNKEKRLEILSEIVFGKKYSLKGFTHKVNSKNPIVKLLYKNQYITQKNKNLRKIIKVFLGNKEPSLFLVLPVIIRNELLGLIVCVSTLPFNEISLEDLRITHDISGQLAVILNQSAMYEESLSTAQREFLLNSITTMIRDTLEVEGVLEKTAREVGQVFGVNACGAFLQKESEKGFVSKLIWAVNDDFKNKLSLLPIEPDKWEGQKNPLLPSALNQSIALSDIKESKLHLQNSLIDQISLKSYLACSLNRGNKTVGVLVLAQFDQYRGWTSSEIQLLEAITDQVEMALSQAELYQHVQQTERQMNLLHQVSSAIRDSLNLSDVMARTAHDLGEILGVSRCFIRRLKSASPLQILATEQEYLNDKCEISKASDLILEFEQKWLESLNNLPEVDRAGSVLHITDVSTLYRDVKEPLKSILDTIQIKSFLGVPLVAAGNVIGCISIHQCDRGRAFTKNEIEFVSRVASEASVAVLNADLFTKVQYQAQRDSLTQLYNHAYFETALHHEVERAKRTGSDLSVIMIDLDYLKPINDKFGHGAGDEAITLVAGKLQQCLRQMDIVSRYGGDEFAALLPETSLESATAIAKRILDTLNRTIHSKWGALSASIGVAGTPHEERNKEKIMKAADDAMYLSKKEGRNRVTPSTILDSIGVVEKKPLSREQP